ncbi:alkylmercury lyase [Streptomyces sp. SA15]|uniref:alkylmercury lyase n=1 Tax=Streptomyces sp. SA15 TaxID=934019 RepID=UPI00117D2F48|nr:alkylmercury lyase [Streptomyces sp. SA15]
MELVVLAVPDCPNAPTMLRRLEQVLPHEAAPVDVRVITNDEEAARTGMHGSPTLLINGNDPFAPPDADAGVSCRIYRDADGRTSGAPSIEQLADALKRAGRGE